MSYESDTRVVELQFNNKQFEADVSQTIKTLNKLDESLQLDAGVEGFNKIEKASKKVNFDALFKNVDELANRFTLLGTIQRKVFEEIGDRIIMVERKFEGLVKSMSVDQIFAGWDKYAEKTAAVQTIMSATAGEIEDAGERMEYVNMQLERLNWFTDETSHNFLDMVNNIGKFTANQVPLEQAVSSMQGIATWASKSGASVGEAGRAMYNLSQAISSGALRLMDWKSIELANMATAEFKQTAIETAVELGRLAQVDKDLWVTLNGTEVSVKRFRDTLSEGWLDSDVLLATLGKYGNFTIELNEAYEKTGLLTSQLLKATEQYAKGNKDLSKWIDKTTLSAEEFEEVIASLAREENTFGRQAFQAAQEAKTFGEVIASVKDAVSSKWMNIFETIFGDYMKAKELWTNLSEYLWDIFAGGLDAKNQMLQLWSAIGGRDELIQGFKNIAAAVESIIEPIKRAWRELFPETTASKLYYATLMFRRLTESMIQTEDASNGIYRAFKLIFMPIKLVATATKIAVLALVWLASQLFGAVNSILAFVGAGHTLAETATEIGNRYNWLGTIFTIFGAIIRLALVPVKALKEVVVRLLDAFKDYYGVKKTTELFALLRQTIANTLIRAIGGLTQALEACFNFMLQHIPTAETMAKVIGFIASAFDSIVAVLGGAFHICALFFQRFSSDEEKAAEATKQLNEYFQQFKNALSQKFSGITTWLTSLFQTVFSAENKARIADITTQLRLFFGSLSAGQTIALVVLASVLLIMRQFRLMLRAITSFTNGLSGVEGVLKGLKGYFYALTRAVKYSALIQLGAGFMLIAGALLIISKIPKDSLWDAVGAMAAMGAVSVALIASLSLLTSISASATKVGTTLAAIGLGLMLFIKALEMVTKLGDLDIADWTTMLAILLMYIVGLGLIGKYVPGLKIAAAELLAVAGAIYILATAFGRLVEAVAELRNTGLSGDEIGQIILSLATIIGAYAGVLAMAKHVSFGSGAGLLGIAISLMLFMRTVRSAALMGVEVGNYLKAVSESWKDHWLELAGVVVAIGGSIGALLILIKAAKGLSWNLMAVGGTLLASALAIKIAINTLASIQDDMISFTGVISYMFIIVSGVSALYTIFSQMAKFKFPAQDASLWKSMLAMAISALSIALALKLLAGYQWGEIGAGVAAMSVVLVAFGAAMALANSFGGAANPKAIKQMTVTIAAITGLLVAMSFFRDKNGVNQLLEPAEMLGKLLLTLGVAMFGAGVMARQIDFKSLGMMAVNIVAVGGVLMGLAYMGVDWQLVESATLGIAAVILAIGAATALASANLSVPPWQTMLAISGIIISIALAFGIIAYGANGMTWDQMAVAFGGLAAVVLAIGAAGGLAAKMDNKNFLTLLGIALIVVAIGGALYFVAQNDWQSILAAMLALVVSFGLLAAASKLIETSQGAIWKAIAILAALDAILWVVSVSVDNFGNAALKFAEAIERIVAASEGLDQGHIDAAVNFVNEMIDQLTKTIDTRYDDIERAMYDAGVYVVRGFIDGIDANYGNVDGAANALWQRFVTTFESKRNADINSPSAYMAADGHYVVLGFVNGVVQNLATVRLAADGMWHVFENEVDTGIPAIVKDGQIYTDAWAAGIEMDKPTAEWAASQVASSATGELENETVLDEANAAGKKTIDSYFMGLLEKYPEVQKWFENNGIDVTSLLSFIKGDYSGILNPRDEVAKWLSEADRYNYEGMRRMGMSQKEAFEKLGYDPYDSRSREQEAMRREMEKTRKEQEAQTQELLDQLADESAAASKAGGAAASLADETENLADVTTYAADAVLYLNKKYEEQDKSLGGLTNTLTGYFEAQDKVLQATNKTGEATDKLASALENKTPYERAIEATEQLVLSHLKYVSSVDDSIQGVQRFGDMTVDQLERAKAEWESFAAHLQTAFGDGDMWGSPIGVGEEWNAADYDISKYIDNLNESINDRKILSNLIEQLYTLGLDPKIIEEIMDKGTGEAIKIAYGITQGSAAQIAQLNQLYTENATQKTDMPYDFLLKSGFQLKPEDVQELGSTLAGSIQNAVHSKQFANGLYEAGADMYMMLMSIDNKDDLFAKMYELGLGDYFGSYIQQHGKTDAEDYGEMIYDIITMWTNDTLNNWETQIRNMYTELQGMQIVGIQADNMARDFASSLWPSYQEALAQYQAAVADWKAGGQAGVMPKLTDYYSSTGRMNGNLSAQQATAAVNSTDRARAQSRTTNVGGTVINNNNTINQTFESENDGFTDAYIGTNSALARLDRRDPHYMAEFSKAFND